MSCATGAVRCAPTPPSPTDTLGPSVPGATLCQEVILAYPGMELEAAPGVALFVYDGVVASESSQDEFNTAFSSAFG